MSTLTAARRRLLDELLQELAADPRARLGVAYIDRVRALNLWIGTLDAAELDDEVIGVPV